MYDNRPSYPDASEPLGTRTNGFSEWWITKVATIRPSMCLFDFGTPLATLGTEDDYRVVHLQRLANPLQPFDIVLNPYLTVDSMSVDLTVFNGVTSKTEPNASIPEFRLASRQRGNNAKPIDPTFIDRELWKHEPSALEGATAAVEGLPDATHYFEYQLPNSLGFLNYFENKSTVPPEIRGYGDFFPAEPSGAMKPSTGAPDTVSVPLRPPFPWLTWNNRPFVSAQELMLVPLSRSSRLPYEFSLNTGAGTPYTVGSRNRFGHLLNFFQSGDESNPGPSLYRLFEYATVPSKFFGHRDVSETRRIF